MIDQPAHTIPPPLMKPDQAAKMLSISPRSLWTLTDNGEIPCVRLGRSVRYDSGDLRNYIEAKKQPRE